MLCLRRKNPSRRVTCGSYPFGGWGILEGRDDTVALSLIQLHFFLLSPDCTLLSNIVALKMQQNSLLKATLIVLFRRKEKLERADIFINRKKY